MLIKSLFKEYDGRAALSVLIEKKPLKALGENSVDDVRMKDLVFHQTTLDTYQYLDV
jgi:hypothetical protein